MNNSDSNNNNNNNNGNDDNLTSLIPLKNVFNIILECI